MITLLRLAAAERASQPGRTRTALVVVALATGLLTCTLVLADSMRASVADGLAVEYGPADVVVRSELAQRGEDGAAQTGSSSGIPPQAVKRITATDGVRDVASMVRANAVAQAGPTTVGILVESQPSDRSFRWQQWTAGRPPRNDREIALTDHTLDTLQIGLGDQVALGNPRVGHSVVQVVGVVDVMGSLSRDNSAYGIVTAPVALEWAAAEAPNVLLIDAEPGTDLRGLVGAVNDAAPVGWPQLTRDLIHGASEAHGSRIAAIGLLGAALAGVSLAVAAITLGTTAAAAARSRRKTLALLRCVGASRSHAIGLMTVEVMVPAAIGAAAGVLGGVGLARLALPLIDLVPGLYPLRPDSFTVRAAALLAPLVVALTFAVVAALVPAVLASRVRPAEALSDARGRPSRPRVQRLVHLGSAFAGVAGVALIVWGASMGNVAEAALGAILLVVALADLTRPLLSLTGRTLATRVNQPADRLAMADLLRRPGTAAIEAAAISVAVAMLTLAWIAVTGASATTSRWLNASGLADVTIGAPAGAPTISADTLRALRGVDGVTAVAPLRYGPDTKLVGRADGKTVRLAVGTVAADLDALRAVAPDGVSVAEFRNDTVYLPESAFPPFDPGSRVTLDGPNGMQNRLRVAYIDGLPFPSAVTPQTLANAAERTEVREAWISTEPGAEPSRLIEDITGVAVLAGELPASGPMFTDLRTTQAFDTVRSAAIAVLAVSVVVAIVGAVATTAIATGERTHEFAVLRALGLERRSLARMLATRTATVAGTAVLVGGTAGAALGVAATHVIASGMKVEPALGAPVLPIAALAIAVVIAVRMAASTTVESASFTPPARVLSRG